MAVTSTANATWSGDLASGRGTVAPASGSFPEQELTWARRSGQAESGTSPEELLAAAHAGCFSMALSNGLAKSGHVPEKVDTRAEVDFTPGTGITEIRLFVRVRVGLAEADLRRAAEDAKANCPVSKALTGTRVVLAEIQASAAG